MQRFTADIIQIEQRGPATFLVELGCGEIAGAATPGQFVQVRVSFGTDPFLRRTFSLCGTDRASGVIRLLVDVVGPGTRLLCDLRCGGTLDIIGPLGTGFDLRFGNPGPVMLVAGGVGAAPLLFLAERLAGDASRPVIFLMGARTAEHLAVLDGFSAPEVSVSCATDDGSAGYHGFVTGLLEERLRVSKPEAIYVCGPHPMMRAVAAIAARTGIPCQVSLEERMACGIGACLGCAVRLADGGTARSCKEGPVFDAGRLAW
jgi:dihydroorotate dehydrogenase electron transfer subunit